MDSLPLFFTSNHTASQMLNVDMNSLPQLVFEQKSMLTPLDCQLEHYCELVTQNQSHKDKENGEVQKLFYNAKERQRRKRLNILYFQLGSLLPNTNRKNKLSNPAIVSQVLSYIPELLSEIKKLSKRRDKLLASSEILQNSSPMVTVSAEIGSNEVVITVYSCRRQLMLSKLLRLVEQEELDVQSASTFGGGEKVLHTLHLQMMKVWSSLDTALLCNKIVLMMVLLQKSTL